MELPSLTEPSNSIDLPYINDQRMIYFVPGSLNRVKPSPARSRFAASPRLVPQKPELFMPKTITFNISQCKMPCKLVKFTILQIGMTKQFYHAWFLLFALICIFCSILFVPKEGECWLHVVIHLLVPQSEAFRQAHKFSEQ